MISIEFLSMARCGKTIRIQAEYEKMKADGKNVLLINKDNEELLGLETPYDKLFKQWRKLNE